LKEKTGLEMFYLNIKTPITKNTIYFAQQLPLTFVSGDGDMSRPEYLGALIQEFVSPLTTPDDRMEILAHLGNFAYDPINFAYLRQSGAIEIFLDQLPPSNQKLKSSGVEALTLAQIAIAGLSNLSIDPETQEILLKPENLQRLIYCLRQKDLEMSKSSLVTLYYLLYNPSGKETIGNPEISTKIKACRYDYNQKTEHNDLQLENLWGIFYNEIGWKSEV